MTVADQKRFQGEDVRARSFAGPLFEKELEKVERLRFLVKQPAKSLAQAAIAFCLADPAVGCTIAGARNAEQMRENAEAAELILAPEDVSRAHDLWKSGFVT